MTVATSVPRSRPAWTGPVALAAAGAGALAYVGLRDPSTGGGFIPCPFHQATGLWCPGCGMTRALHQLLHGNVAASLGFNLFLPVVLAIGVWLWLQWFWPTVGGRELPGLRRVPKPVWVGLLVALVVFTVARNLPFAPLDALAP
jgi:hypothetical protein